MPAWCQLLSINNSPSVALNRTYALYKVEGAEVALAAAENLRLDKNHLYWTLLGELHRETAPWRAKAAFERAYTLAKTTTDRQTIREKTARLD